MEVHQRTGRRVVHWLLYKSTPATRAQDDGKRKHERNTPAVISHRAKEGSDGSDEDTCQCPVCWGVAPKNTKVCPACQKRLKKGSNNRVELMLHGGKVLNDSASSESDAHDDLHENFGCLQPLFEATKKLKAEARRVRSQCCQCPAWWGKAPEESPSDRCIECHLIRPPEKGHEAGEPESKRQTGIPDVPAAIWGGSWSRIMSKAWTADEPQCILEARAVVLTLQHLCRARGNSGRRHLIIGDAMAVVLALTKGRSSSPVLLSMCRQWCAYSLASDLYTHVRWAPSQRNAADDPSHNRSRHLDGADVAEAQTLVWGATPRKPAKRLKTSSKVRRSALEALEVSACRVKTMRRQKKQVER